MTDQDYPAEQVPEYGSPGQPAIVARMRPHLRLTVAGTIAAALNVVVTVWAAIVYPHFTGPDNRGGSSGDEWAVAAAACAALMLGVCGYQLWGWKRAMAVWQGRRRADLRSVARVSWIAHLGSYAVVLLGIWACLAAAVSAGRFATSAILLLVALVLMIAAQVLAAVQYVRESGPPGTVPSHLRHMLQNERAKGDRYARRDE